MKFVHAADLHLGSRLGGLDARADAPVELIRTAPDRAFRRLAELCETEQVDLLLIAGDLFDRDASSNVRAAAIRTLSDITAAGTRIVAISGNHDAEADMRRRLPRFDGFHMLSSTEPETLDLRDEFGVVVHGRGFDQRTVTHNIVNEYPAAVSGAFNIGLLHTSLVGSTTHDTYAPCTLDDLLALGYDYWALGHIHQRAVYDAPQGTHIIHAGNLQGRHVRETGAKGATLVELGTGARRCDIVAGPRHVELDVLRWHEVTTGADPEATRVEDIADVVAREVSAHMHTADGATPGDGHDHVVRVRVHGRTAAHATIDADPDAARDAIVEAITAQPLSNVWVESVRLATQPQLDLARARERDDVIGVVARDTSAPDDELDPPKLAKLLRALTDDDRAYIDADHEGAASVDEDNRASLLARLLEAEADQLERAT